MSAKVYLDFLTGQSPVIQDPSIEDDDQTCRAFFSSNSDMEGSSSSEEGSDSLALEDRSEKDFYETKVEGASTLFFPGCSLLVFAPEIVNKMYELLISYEGKCGLTYLCCGKILQYEPDSKEIKKTHEKNLAQSFGLNGVKKIIAGCPNCAKTTQEIVKTYGDIGDIEVVALATYLKDKGLKIDPNSLAPYALHQSGDDGKIRVYIHDACPDRACEGAFGMGIREMLSDSHIEITNPELSIKCCGSPLHAVGLSERANTMAAKQMSNAAAKDADAVIAGCMSCVQQLGNGGSHIPILHYLELLLDMKISWDDAWQQVGTRFLFEPYQGGNRSFAGLGDATKLTKE